MIHAPELAEARREGSRRGGHGRSKAERARRLLPAIFGQLEAALAEVHNGTLAPAQGTAMAALAGALVRLVEAGEMALRLEALEQRMGTENRRDRLEGVLPGPRAAGAGKGIR